MFTESEIKTNSNTTKRVAILIDGNNFYNGLLASQLNEYDLSSFNYDGLTNLLLEGRELGLRRFYQGLVKKEPGNNKSEKMVSSQQRLFAQWENNGWEIIRGNMQKSRKFGPCTGFYFFNQDIKDKYEFKHKRIAQNILEKFKLHYEPIIVIPKNSPRRENFKKALSTMHDDELIEQNGIYYVLNYWEEKGVDVNIAIDILEIAYLSKLKESDIDTIILISSDSDLKPSIEKAVPLGINIEYVGFDKIFSLALINNKFISKRTLLNKKQLEQYLNRKLL